MADKTRIELIREDIEIANERHEIDSPTGLHAMTELQRSCINSHLIWALGGLEILGRFTKHDNDCLGDDDCKCGLIKILEEIGI